MLRYVLDQTTISYKRHSRAFSFFHAVDERSFIFSAFLAPGCRLFLLLSLFLLRSFYVFAARRCRCRIQLCSFFGLFTGAGWRITIPFFVVGQLLLLRSVGCVPSRCCLRVKGSFGLTVFRVCLRFGLGGCSGYASKLAVALRKATLFCRNSRAKHETKTFAKMRWRVKTRDPLGATVPCFSRTPHLPLYWVTQIPKRCLTPPEKYAIASFPYIGCVYIYIYIYIYHSCISSGLCMCVYMCICI